jgi:hypothetical protein
MSRFAACALFAFATLLLFVGCVETKSIPSSTTVTGIDFSQYASQGFLFTPDPYSGEFQSMGTVQIQVTPEAAELATTEEKARQKSVPEGYYRRSNWIIKRLDTDSLVAKVYRQAREMGADAITHFNVQQSQVDKGPVVVPQVTLSGFAIDRTDVSN